MRDLRSLIHVMELVLHKVVHDDAERFAMTVHVLLRGIAAGDSDDERESAIIAATGEGRWPRPTAPSR